MSKQNTGRKFFATAATAALVASAIVPVASAAEFTDAEKIASWATEAVEALAANEVISGNPDGSFNPTGTVTRAEAAKMFTVALGLDTKGTETFADVKDGQWFQEFVVAVVNAGIVNGMTTTEFAPNGKLTREQAAKMIVEAYGLEGEADLSTFADAKSVAGKWSEGYLATAVENGIIAGKGDKLAATDSISRQEFAVMLNRAITGADTTEADKAAAVKAVEEATASLEEATKALSTEVATDKIAEAKVAVAAAKAATTKLEEAVKAATELEAITEEQAKAATEATAKTAEALKVTEAAIAKAEEAAKVLAVESATALNATQVEVTFNKEVSEATATVIGNYYVNGTALTAADATVELSEDGKVATITFSASKNNTSFTLKVKDVKTKDSKQTVQEFSSPIAVSDNVAPTVKTVEFAANGNLEITFSEPLSASAPIVRVDNKPVTVETVTAGDTKVVVLASNVTVSADKAAAVFVAGAKDIVGNEMALFNGSVTKVADKVAPTITSMTQVGQDTVRVVFSEVVTDELANGELKFLKGAVLNATDSTVVKNTTVDKTGKTYDVTFTATEIYGSGTTAVETAAVTLLLAKDAVKDAANGNVEVTQSFTFTADKTAPKFVSSVVSDDKSALELSFDEELTTIDATKVIVTDSEGVRYPVDAATTVVKTGDSKVLVVKLGGVATIENGTYTVQLQAGAVQDAQTNKNVVATTQVVVGNAADTVKPVASLGTSAVNKFVVNFDKEVTTETALNLKNYTLDGLSLDKVAGTVVYFNATDKKSVTIELAEGTINMGDVTNGTDAQLTVENVSDKAGNLNKATNLTVKVGDNTAAVLTGAQKLGNTLVLTFGEDLAATAVDANLTEVLANYDIKIDDVSVVVGTGSATAALLAGSKDKVQITFADVTGTGYDAAKTVTVTTKANGDLTDANGFKVKAEVKVTAQ